MSYLMLDYKKCLSLDYIYFTIDVGSNNNRCHAIRQNINNDWKPYTHANAPRPMQATSYLVHAAYPKYSDQAVKLQVM